MTPSTQVAKLADRELSSLDVGRRAIEIEARGLTALAAALQQPFADAVTILADIRGKVVVSGMGKSGHVGHKIAATLASTGTPAFFVHPAEASHGDLGMITADDAIICLSYSGNTNELTDIVSYAKRFTIPLIGIVGAADSALGSAADVCLLLPPATEACPMGLAPTTSTTMMLVLGDALAVALLERRGFTSDGFKVFHPGGNLGKRLLKVADVMHSGEAVPLIAYDRPMTEAILTISAKSFGCVGIVDAEQHLIGVITDGDLRRHMGPDLLNKKASDVMTHSPKTIEADALAQEAVGRMNARSITSLFVTAGGKRPIGIVHIHDCLRAGVV